MHSNDTLCSVTNTRSDDFRRKTVTRAMACPRVLDDEVLWILRIEFSL
jgi:hypothetical protein